MFAEDEDEVRERERQRDLDQGKVAHTADDPAERVADHQPNDDPAEKDDHEVACAAEEIGVLAADDHRRKDGEQDDRGGVVEQAFALDQDRQPFRRPEVAEQGYHGDRIGRRNDRAQEQAADEIDIGDAVEHGADDDQRNHQPDHRQHQDWRDIVQQTADVDLQRRAKDQCRQEDEQDDVRGDP